MPAPAITDTEKFFARVEQRGPTQCWWWTGAVDQAGFPRMKLTNGSQRSVARFAWEIIYMKGPIPAGFVVVRAEHDWDLCPDPSYCVHRMCLNPAHLRLAVKSTLDGERMRARNETTKAVCRRGHTLSDDNVVWLSRRNNKRVCRICHTDYMRDYRASHR